MSASDLGLLTVWLSGPHGYAEMALASGPHAAAFTDHGPEITHFVLEGGALAERQRTLRRLILP